jgi:hypothetical protein
MDFVRLIRSVEEFVYEICVWILLIPKTLFKIIFNPKWVILYIKEELAKEEKKQFQEYVPPMLFWVLIVVIPTFIILRTLSVELSLENKTFTELWGNSLETKILVISAFLVAGPLTFSWGIQKKQKKPITKDSFRENFYIQVYVFSPLQFFTVWIFLVNDEMTGTLTEIIILSFVLIGSLYAWWFIACEMYVIKTLLNTQWWKSFLWLTVFSLPSILITLIIVFYLVSIFLPEIEGLPET